MWEDATWLRGAADEFYWLADAGGCDSADTWSEAITWLALQVSQHNKNTRRWQLALEGNYPPESRNHFRSLLRFLNCGIDQNPHRNVLHMLMRRLRLAPDEECYNEDDARRFLDEDIWTGDSTHWAKVTGREVWTQLTIDGQTGYDENEYMDPLAGLEYLTILDDQCAESYGSRLVAAANIWRERQPSDFPNRLLLIAAAPADPACAMMAYIQLTRMGMAAYVLTDNEYQAVLKGQNGLFAPPTALCSPAFAGEVWAERCWKCISNRFYGGNR